MMSFLYATQRSFLGLILCFLGGISLLSAQHAYTLGRGCASPRVARDTQGNVYVAGNLDRTIDADPLEGIYEIVGPSFIQNDAGFLASYKTDGSLNFAFSLGTGQHAEFLSISSLTVGEDGNVYVCGAFRGAMDFDPSGGVFEMVSELFGNVFVASYSSNGSFLHAFQLGMGTLGGAPSLRIQVDAMSNLYLTSFFAGLIDFDPGPDTTELNAGFDSHLFLASYTSTGQFRYVRDLSPEYVIYPNVGVFSNFPNVAIGRDGSAVVTGTFYNTVDFDFGAGTFFLDNPNGSYRAMFVVYLDSIGNFVDAFKLDFASSSPPGGPQYVVVDELLNVTIAGQFNGELDLDPSTGSFLIESNHDFMNATFIASYTSTGAFRYGLSLGEKAHTFDNRWAPSVSGMAFDAAGNLYLSGHVSDTIDFDPSTDLYELDPVEAAETFVASYDVQGQLRFVKGGISNLSTPSSGIWGYGPRVAVNPANGEFTVVGDILHSIEWNSDSNAYFQGTNGGNHILVSHYGANGSLPSGPGGNTTTIAEPNSGLSLYPNPNQGQFIIELPHAPVAETRLKVMNAQGQQVHSHTYPFIGSKEIFVQMDNLPKGVYFVAVEAGVSVWVQRMRVE